MPTLAVWKPGSATLALGVNILGCGMAYAYPGAGALDISLCHYEGSRLLFRGPARRLDRPFVAVLGASESYGKYVERPYADLIQGRLGLNVVNLSCVNAGVDVFLNEEPITRIAARAEVAIVQVMGVQNTSNMFYSVHPRRNDRFLGATPLLQSMFPSVDFTEFSFTRHMLCVLLAHSPEKFAVVATELRRAWSARMKALTERLPRQRILLWMGNVPPPATSTQNLSGDPIMVDAQMIAALRPHFTHYAQVTPSHEATVEGGAGRVFSEMDEVAALALPGQSFHRDVAACLGDLLEKMI